MPHLPHILKTGLRVQMDNYLDVLRTVVFSWIREITGNHLWVWQQDIALCHVSGKTLAWLKDSSFVLV